MKKVSRENLDALFAAIAEAKKLYLPVADSTDEKRSAKYTVWTPKTKYASEAVNTVRSAKDFFFPQVENMVNFKVNGKNYTRNYLTHEDLLRGMTINCTMSAAPTKTRG